MRSLLISLFLTSSFLLVGQGNCLIYPEGSGERKACEICQNSGQLQQGSRASQMLFDSAIAIGPNYAWAYYQKSVGFLKRGFLQEGLESLDKAVELDPLEHLCYRAFWFWQYRNYKLCIRDLERYYSMPKSYLQFTPGGEKDMRMILGLAYAKNKNYEKAIQTIEQCILEHEKDNAVGIGDYHSLGLLYVKTDQFEKAITTFEKQFKLSKEIADSYYFLGLAYQGKSEFREARKQFEKALVMFENRNRYGNPNAGFRIYPYDVEKAIESM